MKFNFILILIVCLLTACEEQIEEFAYDWSKDVKAKIIEESHIESDRVEIDSTLPNWQTVIYWKGDKKLREYNYQPMDEDTIVSIFYSNSQNFELVRELCPGVDRSFEGIRYKGEFIGLAEFRYCNGDIQAIGFRLDGDVGVWKEFDEHGEQSKSKDHGNIDRLKKLKEIKYE